MKKIFNIIIMFSVFVQFAHSQTCIPIPTEFGEIIAKHFIAQSKASEMPYASKMEADTWTSLLENSIKEGIDFSTLKYETTYFTSNDAQSEYDIVVVLKTDKEPLELRFSAKVVDNKWSLFDSQYAEILAKMLEAGIPLPKTPKYEAKTITSTDCLNDANLFVKSVIAHLESNDGPKGMTFLMSETDYKKHIAPDFSSYLNQLLHKDNLREEDKQEITATITDLKNNPSKVYTEEVIDPIFRITSYLKSVNFSASKIQKTHFFVQNHNYKILKDGTITLDVNVEFSVGKRREGILFVGYYLNNQWVLSRVQGSTYGIEDVISE